MQKILKTADCQSLWEFPCPGENTALLWKLKFLTSVSCPVDIRHLFMCRSQVAWKYQNDPWPGHCHFGSCSSSQHHLIHIALLVNVAQYYWTCNELFLLNIEATQLCSPIINTKASLESGWIVKALKQDENGWHFVFDPKWRSDLSKFHHGQSLGAATLRTTFHQSNPMEY